jgi:acetyl esterase/lipase
LLDNGSDGQHIVVAGDSAGGNLALVLLLCLREGNMPLPRLAVCLSPWVDMGNSGGSMTTNEPFDWVQKRMAERWAAWYCNGADPGDPHISPLHADLHGLPPIYIQAGDAEIFFDMVRQFNDAAHKQEADVILEVWEHMNHTFQAYGDQTKPSRFALAHIQKTIERAFRDNAQP